MLSFYYNVATSSFSIGPAYNDSSSTIKIILKDVSTSCTMMVWVVLVIYPFSQGGQPNLELFQKYLIFALFESP